MEAIATTIRGRGLSSAESSANLLEPTRMLGAPSRSKQIAFGAPNRHLPELYQLYARAGDTVPWRVSVVNEPVE